MVSILGPFETILDREGEEQEERERGGGGGSILMFQALKHIDSASHLGKQRKTTTPAPPQPPPPNPPEINCFWKTIFKKTQYVHWRHYSRKHTKEDGSIIDGGRRT